MFSRRTLQIIVMVIFLFLPTTVAAFDMDFAAKAIKDFGAFVIDTDDILIVHDQGGHDNDWRDADLNGGKNG